MGVIYQTEKRSIIPRLRSLQLSSTSRKLAIPEQNKLILNIDSQQVLLEQKEAWGYKNDISHAGDLLSSAFVLGVESQYQNVAKFILNSEHDQTSPVFKLASRTLGIPIRVEEEKLEFSNNQDFRVKYFSQIRKYKTYLALEPRNPIAWVELGRLYIIVGENEKAKKSIDNALYLDKNNRFIVRSASRFYHHLYDDKDYALKIIKSSDYIKNDPWLISAEIAYSTLLNRHSTMAKLGMEYLKKEVRDYSSITELASAIGTLEANNDKNKEARKYFQQSLVKPNDNSIAQYLWMFKKINGTEIDVANFHIPFAYEAAAQSFYNKNDYLQAYQNAIKWYEDEPYSTRPIRLASYLACTFLDDYKDEGISFLRRGIKMNSDDIALNNNLVYYLIQNNQTDEAVKIFQKKLRKYLQGTLDSKDNNIISLIATAGLIFYRQKELEYGRILYKQAINLAKKKESKYLIALATVNYIREEFRVTEREESLATLLNQLNAACKNIEEPDVKLLYKKALEEYKKISFQSTDLLFKNPEQ